MTIAQRTGIGALAIAIAIGVSACGSSTSGEATPADDTASTSSSLPATSATESAPTPPPPAAGVTIDQYVAQNGITSTPVLRGEPGAPTITLPLPPGWENAGERAPQGSYDAIIYTAPPPSPTPPVITAYVSKLTGQVDAAKILEYAPAETMALPGFQGATSGQPSSLANFDATQIGGFYTKEGLTRLIAQKTVVIPASDGLFVLKIVAEGTEDLAAPLMEATSAIDEQTTIVV